LVNKLSKYQIATFIALLFHLIGLAGILFFSSTFFIESTSFNLLLSGSLLVWTQKEKNRYFYFFVSITFLIGFAAEVIGVNTGLLFGNYSYGDILGFQWRKVPLIIGINWFIVLYCSGITIHTLLTKVVNQVAVKTMAPPPVLKAISLITDGATLAVLYDWLMEPVAVKLGFWQWADNDIPAYNYICWLAISALLLTVFHFCKFNKQNKFAINLLLIQVMFFLLLRTFLK
jgi:putative membrane protein